ncbi:hypothetical protein Gotur_000506 [Gossypium turneri]
MAEYEGINAVKKTEKIFKSHRIQENVPRISIKFDTALDSRTFKSGTGLVGWDMRGNLLVLKTEKNWNVIFQPWMKIGKEIRIEEMGEEAASNTDSLMMFKSVGKSYRHNRWDLGNDSSIAFMVSSCSDY